MRKIVIFISFLLIVAFNLNATQTESNISVEKSPSLITNIENWYKDNMNYLTITLLMTAESSILPVPSEMVIPPAVYVAMDPDSKLNIFLIILFGTLGAMIGASINYIVSLSLGRLVVYKFADSKIGKLLLLSSAKVKKSEDFFNNHGKTSTFIGRLIPVVRHLISIPAGLAKMNYLNFLVFTFLGAGLWNIILALLGYLAHGQQDLINKYSHELSYLFLFVGVVVVAWYIFKTFRKKTDKKTV